jgi:hypothetical protein
MDKNKIGLVALFLADTLVHFGVIPPPKDIEDADEILRVCASQFLRFLSEQDVQELCNEVSEVNASLN